MSHDPIYLDYAATSAVRPDAVAEAVASFLRGLGGTPGRSGHRAAVEASRLAFRCRRGLCDLLGLPGDPGRLVFMANATMGLNVALRGLLGPGDVVVASRYDHNAVLRPLHALREDRGVRVRMLSGNAEGTVDLDEAERLFAGARLVVVNGASNVLGTVAPLEALAARARAAGALVLLDAAQTAGHVPTRPAEEGADVVAFTGHKGLLGPQGIGALWIREGLEVEPLLSGGTGGDSLSREMPGSLPDRLEPGTLNAPGIAGLAAALGVLRDRGIDRIHAHESALKRRLHEGLSGVGGLRVLSPIAPEGVGIVTVTSDRTDPATLARRLDLEHGVMTRPGLHCAPEVHRILGTAETGAVRFSLGWASSVEEVDRAVAAVDRIHHDAGVRA